MKKCFQCLTILAMCFFMALPAHADGYTIQDVWNDSFVDKKRAVSFETNEASYSESAGGFVFPFTIKRNDKLIYKGTAKITGSRTKDQAFDELDMEAARINAVTAENEYFIIILRPGFVSGATESLLPNAIDVIVNPNVKNPPNWTYGVLGRFLSSLIEHY